VTEVAEEKKPGLLTVAISLWRPKGGTLKLQTFLGLLTWRKNFAVSQANLAKFN